MTFPFEMSQTCDIAIIGAGAAGLMASIHAGRAAGCQLRILALDGAKSVGAKILVAGGGRCNVTHDVIHAEDYAPANRNRVNKVLRSFTVEQTIEFFASLGVQLKVEDTGKLFPVTDRAQTVLDALLRALRDAGVTLKTQHRVASLSRDDQNRFIIETSQGVLLAHRVILSTGGRALPRTGSDGAGYAFARAMGHHVTDTTPALVPLTLPAGHWLTSLSGIAFDTTLSLWSSTNKLLHQQPGAMLLTHKGISGPAAMDMSRHWLAARKTDPGVKLTAAMVPGMRFEAIDKHLADQAVSRRNASVLMVIRQWMPERLAQGVLDQAGISSTTLIGKLPREGRRKLALLLEALPVPVTGDRGYTYAEVTAGGVPLEEIDLATMASRLCPGLYLAGEILDVDGRIGGYNFQWAWCTGRLAGNAAARSLLKDREEIKP